MTMPKQAPVRNPNVIRLMKSAVLLIPAQAIASDMTALMFVYSLPICIVLVLLILIPSFYIKPAAAPFLIVPGVGLVIVNLFMLPHMNHLNEQLLYLLQLLISTSALFAFPIIKSKSERERKNR